MVALSFTTFYCSVDDGFPVVTFHFENSLVLEVYPHDYLFPFVSIFCYASCHELGYLFTRDISFIYEL